MNGRTSQLIRKFCSLQQMSAREMRQVKNGWRLKSWKDRAALRERMQRTIQLFQKRSNAIKN